MKPKRTTSGTSYFWQGGKLPCVYFIVPVIVSLGRPQNEAREPGADLCTDDHNQIFMQQEESFPLPAERSRGSASRLPAVSRLLLLNITNSSQVSLHGFQVRKFEEKST